MKRYLIILLLFLFQGCGNDTDEREIIIVPPNFKGHILIIFNQSNGIPVEYDGDKRVYNIPKNGVLKTQQIANYGNVGLADFYYKSIDSKNKIPTVLDFKKLTDYNEVIGYRKGVGIAKKNPNNDKEIEFAEFYIGTRSDIESFLERTNTIDVFK